MPDFVELIDHLVLPTVEGSELAGDLSELSRLYALCAGLQTQPAALAEPLLEATRSMNESVPRLSSAITAPTAEPGPGAWMALSYLALIRELLTDDWDRVYGKIMPAYPALDAELTRLRELVGSVAFAEALARLEDVWRPGREDVRDLAAILFIRSAALIDVFGSRALYTKVAAGLDPRQPFLNVYVTAACLMTPKLEGHIDLGRWTKEQYDCIALLDNFHFLAGAQQWG